MTGIKLIIMFDFFGKRLWLIILIISLKLNSNSSNHMSKNIVFNKPYITNFEISNIKKILIRKTMIMGIKENFLNFVIRKLRRLLNVKMYY